MPMSLHCDKHDVEREGGEDIIKRRLLRFDFDILKSWENFKNPVKNKATWMSHGYVLYSPDHLYTLIAFFLDVVCCTYGEGNVHIGVRLRRCSFRQDGQFLRASGCEASDRAELHVFFLCLKEAKSYINFSKYYDGIYLLSNEIFCLGIDQKS